MRRPTSKLVSVTDILLNTIPILLLTSSLSACQIPILQVSKNTMHNTVQTIIESRSSQHPLSQLLVIELSTKLSTISLLKTKPHGLTSAIDAFSANQSAPEANAVPSLTPKSRSVRPQEHRQGTPPCPSHTGGRRSTRSRRP